VLQKFFVLVSAVDSLRFQRISLINLDIFPYLEVETHSLHCKQGVQERCIKERAILIHHTQPISLELSDIVNRLEENS